MVISKISMGLGNQMFQYAAGKSLALHKNVPFKVEVHSYKRYKERKYELDTFFAIETEKATEEEIRKYQLKQPVKILWNSIFSRNKIPLYSLAYEQDQLKRMVLKLSEVITPSAKKKVYLEPEYHFNDSFFKTPDEVFLIGYFMSWKYFEKFEKEIRRDFTVRPELVSHLHQIESELRQNNSVSIHIRRGDFTSKKNIEIHGIISMEFYRNAIAEISSRSPSPHLYVFSDDIAWVKENLQTQFPITFVSNEVTKTAVEDFYLMSVCKHNIIANSTFSWWAAYLNNNPGKIVVAPKKWYNSSTYNYKDVYPRRWIVLDS
ncbi:MAG: alpha,2-fucosyltransferase [Segetibacter sp.]|nr:alpha,2-fucosyltransferase [Segetibacter sp.]